MDLRYTSTSSNCRSRKKHEAMHCLAMCVTVEAAALQSRTPCNAPPWNGIALGRGSTYQLE
eukprot:3474002-Amphidinium_carterae.1